MATKPTPTGLNDEQAAILTPGNFVLHAVYQGGTDGYTRSAIYQPLYVVDVEGETLHFIAEPVGEIRTMRALNLFENAPKGMPPKVVTPEEADKFVGFSSAVSRASAYCQERAKVFDDADTALRGGLFETM
jgi:hypothetical protein